MPADVELARREGIELIHTGSWSALSGSWKPTRADILAAVEAQQCPAVRRPRLKLGHTDARFNGGGDGEPALGWIENLRTADDGNTLIGDQVALPWLSAVQAAAYPDRSIEGNYRHVCALGHTHPFVLTAVALLGVTPPAVSTLKSVQDLPAMLGVAASEEVPDGAEHVSVTVRAGRHGFDEAKVKRDGDGQFANKAGGGSTPVAPADAKPGAPLKDVLKLDGRIALGGGETLAGSDNVKGSGIVGAAVDGPDGRKVRLGFVDPDDTRRWRGADGGSTVVLDGEGVAALQAAIPDMLRWADEGKAHDKAFEQRDKELQAKERAIVNKQYPELTKAGAKELERIDRALSENRDRLDNVNERQTGRHRHVPDEAGREQMADLDRQIGKARASNDLDRVAALQLRQRSLLWGHSEAEMRELDAINATPWGSRTDAQKQRYGQLRRPGNGVMWEAGLFFDQDLRHGNDLHGQRQALETRRSALTVVSVPLSGEDQSRLDDIRMAIGQNDESWSEFNDGAYLTDGVISGEWGDIVYQVTMGHGPDFQLTVRPADAGPEWTFHGGMGETDAAELKKLAAMLGRLSGAPPVAASGLANADATKVHVEWPASSGDSLIDHIRTAIADRRPEPNLPAAEPEQLPSDPKEKDDMSDTDLSGFRSRLGLTDDASQDQILEALDALKAKADTPEPTPEMVAASAAATDLAAKAEAEKNELRKEVSVLASQVQTMSAKIADQETEAAKTVKASVLDEAQRLGKYKPAEREQWEADYDEAPGVTTRTLSRIAVGYAVPVLASGVTGPAEPASTSDGDAFSEGALDAWAKQLGVDAKELSI